MQEIRGHADEEIARLRSEMQRRGVFHSGMHVDGQIEIQVRTLQELMNRWIAIRRELVGSIPELGSTDQLSQLRRDIEQMLDAQWARASDAVMRSAGASATDVQRVLASGQHADTLLRLKSEAGREIGILQTEVRLRMHEPARPASGITINIQESTVGALNLGNVMGDLRATVVSLHDAGNAELATILKDLIERVAAAAELGDERREIIESLTVVAEQATLPEDRRKPGMVRKLMTGFGPVLSRIAELAQVWEAAGPAIAGHFGFPWP
jgi:hypothetical protein